MPQQYFAETCEAYHRAGRSSSPVLPDALTLSDAAVFSVAKAALAALEAGEVDLYADACARFLAAHLLGKTESWARAQTQKISSVALSDRRLRRVLEFMQQEFAGALNINQLAREAGISSFHFARTFKAKIGVTPHQHIRRLRLRHARVLLAETDLSVLQVAEACGYVHDGHFAAAFQRTYGCSPSAFRKLLRHS